MSMASDTAKTFTIPGVEILRTGTWNGREYTTADLDAIADAHEALKSSGFLVPRVTIDHSEKSTRSQGDGGPALGFVDTVERVGDRLIASLIKVPAMLASAIQRENYQPRSVEIWWDVELGGQTFPAVLSVLSFLGADLPAVDGLAGIEQMYAEQPEAATALSSGAAGESQRTVVHLSEIPSMKKNPKVHAALGLDDVSSEKLGKSLGSALRNAIEAAVGDNGSVEEVMAAAGRAAGISGSTVGQIASGDIDCPPESRIRGLAKALDVSAESLMNAAESDGCSFAPPAQNERDTEQEKSAMTADVISALGLDSDASKEDVLGAIDMLKSGIGKDELSLKESNGKLIARVTKLEKDIAKREAESSVTDLIRAGRLLPKQRDQWVKLCLQDHDLFTSMSADLEVQVDLEEHGHSGSKNIDEFTPTKEELAFAQKVDPTLTIDDLRAQKARDAGKELPAKKES